MQDRQLQNSERPQLRPFVKWAGGKGQLLTQIQRVYPKELGGEIYKYAEPFVGGGAVLFDLLSRYNFREVYISDINQELINTYRSIQKRVAAVIRLLKRMEREYVPLTQERKEPYYYEKRSRFNQLMQTALTGPDPERAALFIFLNKACYNGLYRVNSKGLFNVPVGRHKSYLICDEDNLRNISQALKRVTIVCGDYQTCKEFIDQNTLVYFDPPYRPLTNTASFTSYTRYEFGDEHQVELARFITEMGDRGARVILSNSDPRNADSKDAFFDKLYEEHEITRVNAKRMINSAAKGRGEIQEILVTNYAQKGKSKAMAINVSGGGAATNANGLRFEQDTDLSQALKESGYNVVGDNVYLGEDKVARLAGKSKLYKNLLEPGNIHWNHIISKRMLPDEALYNMDYNVNTVFILEKKFQHSSGSVDEKLQTCGFKLKQYRKLFLPLGIKVEYAYILNDWFNQPDYRDVLDYIYEMGCHYFFNQVPLAFLRLPPPPKKKQ